jgi:tRNA dimethylallyltransferase
MRAIEIGEYLQTHPETDLSVASAPCYSYQIFGIDLPVDVRRERISGRLRERLRGGMIEEVQRLLTQGVPAEKLIFYGLEYKLLVQYLTGELDYLTMLTRLETAIHQFAKRQMTFFRKMERDGLFIQWLDGLQPVSQLTDQIVRACKETTNSL